MRLKGFIAAASAVSAVAATALATPLVSDSYLVGTDPTAGQYNTTTPSLNAQPGTLVNTGFTNGGYTSGTGTANWVVTAAGLDNANVGGEAGGAVSWLGASRDNLNRSVARNLSPTINTSTNKIFYESFEISRGDLPTAAAANSFVGVGFANTVAPLQTTASSLFGSYLGFSGATTGDASTNFGSLVIRSRNGTSTTSTADTILVDGATTSTFGTNYFVVMKNTVNSPTDSIEYWVNPSDVTSDATMTSTAAVHGTITTANNGGYQFQGDTGDLTRLNYAAYNWDGTITVDEPRIGLALGDVAVAAPEPSLLGAAAGLLLLGRRRKGC